MSTASCVEARQPCRGGGGKGQAQPGYTLAHLGPKREVVVTVTNRKVTVREEELVGAVWLFKITHAGLRRTATLAHSSFVCPVLHTVHSTALKLHQSHSEHRQGWPALTCSCTKSTKLEAEVGSSVAFCGYSSSASSMRSGSSSRCSKDSRLNNVSVPSNLQCFVCTQIPKCQRLSPALQ